MILSLHAYKVFKKISTFIIKLSEVEIELFQSDKGHL